VYNPRPKLQQWVERILVFPRKKSTEKQSGVRMLNYVLTGIAVLVIVGYVFLARHFFKRTDPKTALAMGFAIGALALAGDFFCAWYISPEKAPVDYLLLIAGGTLGWLVGLLLSPAPHEKQEFQEWGKSIFTFLSGFITCKFLDPMADIIVHGKLTRVWLGEALVFIDAFLICMLMVFVERRYGQNTYQELPPNPLVKSTSPRVVALNTDGDLCLRGENLTRDCEVVIDGRVMKTQFDPSGTLVAILTKEITGTQGPKKVSARNRVTGAVSNDVTFDVSS
jgi:hypothetical protein